MGYAGKIRFKRNKICVGSFYLLQDIFHPLETYRNPCWKVAVPHNISHLYDQNSFFVQNMDSSSKYNLKRNIKKYLRRERNGNLNSRIRCLPYFYVAGVTKSGMI